MNELMTRARMLMIFMFIVCTQGCVFNDCNDKRFSCAFICFEYDTGQEWKRFYDLLRAGKHINPPKSIDIAADDIEITEGTVTNNVKDPRIKVRVEIKKINYGQIASFYYDSLHYGRFRLDVVSPRKGDQYPMCYTLYKLTEDSEIKLSEEKWPKWNNVSIGVHGEDGHHNNRSDQDGIELFFRYIDDE